MHDSRRPLRRLTEPRLVSRAAAHLTIIGLLAFAAAFGFAARQSEQSGAIAAQQHAYSFGFVSTVRGAAAELPPEYAAHYRVSADPLHPDPMLSRRSVATALPTPAATPVAPPPATPEPVGTGSVATAQTSSAGTVGRSGSLLWPVPGGVITQYYHPGHLALDIAAPAGHRVNASDGGVVTWAGWRNNGGGLVVQIDHGNGLQTAYNHLGSIWVGPGQSVSRGQAIAAVGCTGSCTGPHVHFEVIVGGVMINPLRYL